MAGKPGGGAKAQTARPRGRRNDPLSYSHSARAALVLDPNQEGGQTVFGVNGCFHTHG